MRPFTGMLLALSLSLSGCASVPLSTARQLSAQTPQSLAAIDPGQLQVRVALPRDYELDVPGTRLSLSLDGPAGLRNETFTLSLLGVAPETRSAGWLTQDVAVSTYSLSLSPESVGKLRQLQKLAGASGSHFQSFRVKAPLAKQPAQPRELQVWVEIRLSASQSFMSLIDGARLPYSGS